MKHFFNIFFMNDVLEDYGGYNKLPYSKFVICFLETKCRLLKILFFGATLDIVFLSHLFPDVG